MWSEGLECIVVMMGEVSGRKRKGGAMREYCGGREANKEGACWYWVVSGGMEVGMGGKLVERGEASGRGKVSGERK